MARKYVPPLAPQKAVDYDALPIDQPIAVYYRQSRPEQVGNVSTSIQMFDIPDQLKRLGWKEEQIILIDADAGVSGTLKIDERAGMRRLFNMVINHEIGGVATIDEDRLFRDVTMIQVDTFIEACRQTGVMIITPSVRYIFHHPLMGSIYISQFRRKCEIAAEYIDIFIKKRMGGARERIRLEGKWAGQRMYGYMADMRDRKSATYRSLVPHAPLADAIKTIFQTFVECHGNAHETQRVLKDRGFVLPSVVDYPLPNGFRGNYGTKRRNPLPSAGIIRDFVTNVIYRGDYVYRGAVIHRHNHPAIVPDELFTAAFNLASVYEDTGEPNLEYHGCIRYGTPSAHLRKIEPPLLEGRLYISLDGEWQRAGVWWRHYLGGYAYSANRHEAASPNWTRSSAEIDSAIRYLLQVRLAKPATSSTADKNIEDQKRTSGAALKRLNARIKIAERQIENFGRNLEVLLKSFPNVDRDLSGFSEMQSRYAQAKAAYNRMLEQRETMTSDPTRGIKWELQSKVFEWVNKDDLSDADARRLVAAMIERVEVTHYERRGSIRLTIHWTDGEPTHFGLLRRGAKAWQFREIEALKYWATSMSQLVRSAAVPRRTWGAIRIRAGRLGLSKVASGIVHGNETFKDYCRRAHRLQISEDSIRIVERDDGAWEIMVKDRITHATVTISEKGELTYGQDIPRH